MTAIRDAGLRLPDAVHKVISIDNEPVLEADFFYEPHIVVLVHGSVHQLRYVQDMDERKESKVKAAGYIVIIVDPEGLCDIRQKLGPFLQ